MHRLKLLLRLISFDLDFVARFCSGCVVHVLVTIIACLHICVMPENQTENGKLMTTHNSPALNTPQERSQTM